MGSLRDLVIPGVGPAAMALSSILELCSSMKEAQPACEHLHQRLSALFDKLQDMEKFGKTISDTTLDEFVSVIAKFRAHLERYSGKELVFRIAEQHKANQHLLEINEEIARLWKKAGVASSGLDWKEEWDDDLHAQEEVMKATVRDNTAVLRELQGSRAQAEALLMLRFELDKRAARHSEEVLRLMKSVIATIVQASSTAEPPLVPWFLPSYEVEFESKPFARGSFGSVHRGVWGPGTKVVVKCFLVDDAVLDKRSQLQIEKEISLWHQLNHPNVVKMFGASHVSSPPFIVCEEAIHGDLGSYFAISDENKRQMWRLLHQAALGLDYIHKLGVVHGDLKLNNILVGADGQAKLSDFGLSAMRTCSTLSKTAAVDSVSGGLRWRAPECLKRRPTFASDVYSFAMCMIEAAIGEPPFAFLDDDSVRENLKSGEIPDQPDAMHNAVWELVVSMTNLDPLKRVSLQLVIDKLKVLAHNEACVKTESTAIVCTACASTIPTDARFCLHCGAPISLEKNDPTVANTQTKTDAATLSAPLKPAMTGEEDIAAFITLLRNGNDKQKENAARALANLACNDDNKKQIASQGAIPHLVRLLQEGTNDSKETAAHALANLAVNGDSKQIASQGAIPHLVKLFFFITRCIVVT